MGFLSSREFKIFISFFIIYAYFVHWVGWNEYSRFALTSAIADEGRIEIDSLHDYTGDRSFHDGHYYSDKEPGHPFTAVPVYAAYKLLYFNLVPESFIKANQGSSLQASYPLYDIGVIIQAPYRPSFFTITSMVVVTVFTSCLFSAITVVLVYKILEHFTDNDGHRLLLAATYGLGTLAFPYATLFMGHAEAAFLGFLSFYLLFKSKRGGGKDYSAIAGFCAGYSVTVEVQTVLVLLLCFAFALSLKSWRKITLFSIGCALGLSFFLVYNYAAFGNPLTVPRLYIDTVVWPNLGGGIGFNPDPVRFAHVFIKILAFPYRGLFFYYPVMLLAVAGLWWMRKDFKLEAALILLLFVSYVSMLAGWWSWWGGMCFGPRQLLPVIPFLMLPLGYAVRRAYAITVCLAALSILVNTAGLQHYEAWAAPAGTQLSGFFVESESTFREPYNPLMTHYLRLTLCNGPRSRFFENVIEFELPFDVRDDPLSKGSYHALYLRKDVMHLLTLPYLGSVVVRVPFLSIIPVLAFLVFIWRTDIWGGMSSSWKGRFNRFWFIIPLVLLVLFLKVNWYGEVVYKDGWVMPQCGAIWMFTNSTFHINNPGPETRVQLLFGMSTPNESRTIKIFHDNKPLGLYEIPPGNGTAVLKTTPIVLSKGRNVVRFQSPDRCAVVNGSSCSGIMLEWLDVLEA